MFLKYTIIAVITIVMYLMNTYSIDYYKRSVQINLPNPRHVFYNKFHSNSPESLKYKGSRRHTVHKRR